MTRCKFHPEREAVALCEKFGVGYCQGCCEDPALPEGCTCSSPGQHCRFRSQCIVWERSKERRRRQRDGLEGGP